MIDKTTIKISAGISMLLALGLLPAGAAAWKQTLSADGTPISWETSCYYYSVHQDGSDAIAYEDLVHLTRASFDKWQEVPCAYYAFVETAPAGVSRVEFNNDAGNVNLLVWRKSPEEWPHTTSAVALTTVSYDQSNGEIVDVDIEFNEAHHAFGSLDEYPDQTELIDLPSTITHEIGHCIGLDHSEVLESTMSAYTDPGEIIKRTLAPDDIEGLCYIYPMQEDPGICEPPICGLDLLGNTTDCGDDDDTGGDSGCTTSSLGSRAHMPGIIELLLLSLLDQ